MKEIIAVAILGFHAAAFAQAQSNVIYSDTPIRFLDVISVMLKNSPKAKEQRLSNRATTIANDATDQEYLPKINAQARTGIERSTIPRFNGGTLTYNQTLYSPQIDWLARIQALNEEGASKRYEALKQDLLRQFCLLYPDVVRKRHEVKVAEAQVGIANVYLEKMRRRFELGDIPRTAVEQATLRLNLKQVAKAEVYHNMLIAEQAFAIYAGFPPAKELATPTFDDPLLAQTPERLAGNLKHHPRIKAAQKDIAEKSMSVGFERAATAPSIDLVGNYEFKQKENYEAFAWFGLQLTLPIYNKGVEVYKVRSIVEQASALEEKTKALRLDLENQLYNAYYTLQRSHANLVFFRSALQQAKKSLEGLEKLNQLGMTNYIDVLNAIEELASIETNITTEEMNIPERQLMVLWAMGNLTLPHLGEIVK